MFHYSKWADPLTSFKLLAYVLYIHYLVPEVRCGGSVEGVGGRVGPAPPLQHRRQNVQAGVVPDMSNYLYKSLGYIYYTLFLLYNLGFVHLFTIM